MREDDDDEFEDPRDSIPEDMLSRMTMERTVHPEEDEESLSRRLLRENLPMAVAQIAHLSARGTNERIRLDASKYIVERVFGPVSQDNGSSDPLRGFLEKLSSEAEAHANQGR